MKTCTFLQVVRCVLLACLCFANLNCRKQPVTIKYVFPNGFHGIAKLRSHQPNGIKLVPENNVLTLTFPLSGEILISGELPTVQWHKPIAYYQSGNIIPVVTPPNSVSDSDIALRALGSKDNVEDWYVVGKESEVDAAMTQMIGFEFHRVH